MNILQVRSFTDLTRTTADGADTTVLEGSDATATGTNTVEGRNLDFINSLIAVDSPTCS